MSVVVEQKSTHVQNYLQSTMCICNGQGHASGLIKIPNILVSFRGRIPLDLSFWSFLTFLHHGIEDVARHLLWKFHKKIQRNNWSNVSPKLLACIRFLYKFVHKNGPLRKFNRSREIECNFLTAWTIFMKLGTLVHHVHGYKTSSQTFYFLPRDLVLVFKNRKNGVKSSLNLERS